MFNTAEVEKVEPQGTHLCEMPLWNTSLCRKQLFQPEMENLGSAAQLEI